MPSVLNVTNSFLVRLGGKPQFHKSQKKALEIINEITLNIPLLNTRQCVHF